jgi:hypothetical protein
MIIAVDFLSYVWQLFLFKILVQIYKIISHNLVLFNDKQICAGGQGGVAVWRPGPTSCRVYTTETAGVRQCVLINLYLLTLQQKILARIIQNNNRKSEITKLVPQLLAISTLHCKYLGTPGFLKALPALLPCFVAVQLIGSLQKSN